MIEYWLNIETVSNLLSTCISVGYPSFKKYPNAYVIKSPIYYIVSAIPVTTKYQRSYLIITNRIETTFILRPKYNNIYYEIN